MSEDRISVKLIVATIRYLFDFYLSIHIYTKNQHTRNNNIKKNKDKKYYNLKYNIRNKAHKPQTNWSSDEDGNNNQYDQRNNQYLHNNNQNQQNNNFNKQSNNRNQQSNNQNQRNYASVTRRNIKTPRCDNEYKN